MEYINDLTVDQNLTRTLTGEMLLFGLIGKIFYTYPETKWMNFLAREDVFVECPMDDSGQPDLRAGLTLLQQWGKEQSGEESGKGIEVLQGDYTRLFIGPGKVLAPPWESVYFNEDRLTFQETTLQVRIWYGQFGLQAENIHKEPDDHIGLELAFFAHLTQLCLQAIESEDKNRFSSLFDARQRFIQEHLLRWALGFCDLVCKESKTNFYRGAALLLRGALLEFASIYDLKINR